MSADPLQVLARAGKGKSTRSLLRVIILVLIAAAAVASRLFSVIRTCPFVWVLELRGAAFAVPSSSIRFANEFPSPLSAN